MLSTDLNIHKSSIFDLNNSILLFSSVLSHSRVDFFLSGCYAVFFLDIFNTLRQLAVSNSSFSCWNILLSENRTVLRVVSRNCSEEKDSVVEFYKASFIFHFFTSCEGNL